MNKKIKLFLGLILGVIVLFSLFSVATVALATTVSLTADSLNVNYGGSTYLRWSSTDATSCVGTNFNTNNLTSGSFYTGTLTNTTTYNINCSDSNGSASDSVTVVVNSPIPQTPSITIYANPIFVSYGNSSVIYWSSINATSCYASGGWSGNKATSGNQSTGSLFSNTTFGITCNNSSGSTTDSITVSVAPQSVSNPTVSLTADSLNVNYGGSTYLRWSSTDATSCVGTNFNTNNLTSGNFYTGALTNTTTYNINCSDSNGLANDSVTVVVDSQQNLIPDVSTSSATNIGDNYATLNGYVSSNGNTNVSAWFEWGTNSNYYNQTNRVSYGSNISTNYNYYLSGLEEDTTYYFRAVARGNNGTTVYGNQRTFTTTSDDYDYCNTYNCYGYTNRPIVTTYYVTGLNDTSIVLNGYIDPNGSYATRWFEWGTSYSRLYTSTSRINQGTYAGNFSESLYNLNSNTTYYYRAAARGNGGTTVYGNTLTFVTNGGYTYNNTCGSNTYGYNTCTPTAITAIATNIGQSSARLNGLGLVNNAVYTTGYFEYGTTQALGNTTLNKNIGNAQSSPFYESLFNLASGVTYYYRAVVVNQYGTSRGSILSFRTISPTVVNTNTNNIYRNTTVVTNTNTTENSKPSLVSLSVSRDGETIKIGDIVEYVVNYKNVSSKNLKDVVLQISIPKELEFLETNRGYFSPENSTTLANIDSLNSQEEGSVRIRIKVTTNAEVGKIIVVTANLAYTIVDSKTQEEVFAYAKNTIEGRAEIQQGALAFLFGDSFFPNTLLGWLLLILVITLLVLSARKVYYGPNAIAVPASAGKSHK